METAFLLQRTELKGIGQYLLKAEIGRWDKPSTGMLLRDLETWAQDEFEVAVHKFSQGEEEALRSAVEEIKKTLYEMGFITGIKVGARLLLNLTDDTEVTY